MMPSQMTSLPVAADANAADTVITDSLAADSLAADSADTVVAYGFLFEQDHGPSPVRPSAPGYGMSWIFTGIVVLFCLIGLRFQNSMRYLRAMIADLTQTRTRQNAFDETVNETSFLLLLNLMWVACAGVLLWSVVHLGSPGNPGDSFGIPDRPELGIPLCMGICFIYLLLMLGAYWTVGRVFTDPRHTSLWVKGAISSYALCAILFFPLALLGLCYPDWLPILLEIAAGAFILTKILFIFQGFRIFFTHFSSWLLFLYYLCSLETVPLTITYVVTLQLCSMLL